MCYLTPEQIAYLTAAGRNVPRAVARAGKSLLRRIINHIPPRPTRRFGRENARRRAQIARGMLTPAARGRTGGAL